MSLSRNIKGIQTFIGTTYLGRQQTSEILRLSFGHISHMVEDRKPNLY
jgi:hypothetical protein